MRIAHKIFASNICMDTATWDNWSFFLLPVSVPHFVVILVILLFLSTITTVFLTRCRFFAQFYPWVPVVHGVVTFFVIANFTLATFMDPGVIPKGTYYPFFNLY